VTVYPKKLSVEQPTLNFLLFSPSLIELSINQDNEIKKLQNTMMKADLPDR
jgi:hypothetical protein